MFFAHRTTRIQGAGGEIRDDRREPARFSDLARDIGMGFVIVWPFQDELPVSIISEEGSCDGMRLSQEGGESHSGHQSLVRQQQSEVSGEVW